MLRSLGTKMDIRDSMSAMLKLKSGPRLASGLLLAIIALTPVPSVYGQQIPPGPRPAENTAVSRRTAVAHRTSTPPKIDGVLDELAWQDAPPLTDFIQAEPFEGTPKDRKSTRLNSSHP